MDKFLSILCLTLFYLGFIGKKSATEQAAAELKDKAGEAYEAGSKLASEYADVAKDKLAKVAEDAKISADEKYAQEGLKQGKKLGEQAYEVGKDKDHTNEALTAAQKAGVNAYEATLEYGANAEQTLELTRDAANDALKAGRQAGENALEPGKEYVQEPRKKATKKAKETAEETSEKAQKASH